VVKTAGYAGVLSLSWARLTAGRVTTLWVKRLLSVSQQGRLSTAIPPGSVKWVAIHMGYEGGDLLLASVVG